VKYNTARRIKRFVAGVALFMVANLSWGIVTTVPSLYNAGEETVFILVYSLIRMSILTVIGYLAITVWSDYSPRQPKYR
jgi:hypothetical protein